MADRDAILASVDLAALADDTLGPRSEASGHPAWRCPDPAHPQDRRSYPTVAVFHTRRGGERWHCQDCGSGGTAIDLVAHRYGVGIRHALEYLTEWATRQPTAQAQTPPPPAEHQVREAISRTGLDAWVARAEQLLWQPHGEPVRAWLTKARGLPPDVLRINRIGATAITPDSVLPTRRSIAGSRSSSPAAVLPVSSRNRATHAQLRLITPKGDEPRYLNPTPTPGRPRLGLYRPATRGYAEIIVTEGVIDALSANAAGYRAAAVLSPGLADAEVAVHLSRLNGPLVLALDPDGPGDEAADRLMHHLATHGRRPVWLPALNGDLNESLTQAHDWPRKLAAHVRQATAAAFPDHVPAPSGP